MSNKRITNADLYREIGELKVVVAELKEDIQDVGPRVKSLELFRSYVKGGATVITGIGLLIIGILKGVLGIDG